MKLWAYPVLGSILSTVALVLLLLVPLSSLRFGPKRLSPLHLALVDASNTYIEDLEDRDDAPKTKLIGLPDVYDDSKVKQYYYIYLLNYCSGTSGPDGKVVVDFCSKQGDEIWNLFAAWTAFDPNTDDDAKHQKLRFQWLTERPQWLRFGYATAAVLGALNVGVGLVGLCVFRHGKPRWIMFSASVLSTILLFVVVAATQITYGLMVNHAEEQNSVKTKLGIAVYVVNWLALTCSIGSSAVWFIFCRKGSSSKPASGRMDMELAYKYEEVADDGDDTQTHTQNSKTRSRNESIDVLHAHRAGGDARFEPFRPAH
ncbi:hypothetical protein K505DRAFT_335166 [Melanomma pulvis-pyrius CBS 109.77]|uniref:Integral membrane protein-like protein n=1 Tax=Melanomma pulvis-pyrius CBS 109.77 TaxID=1314802 RepID=A0A6A6XJ93_9PLEO|nr:hypothetical protein K505DRAFT_335166 [Melanomma pulvis-pyrius CBS 109.77]